jgi:hypothetical protein
LASSGGSAASNEALQRIARDRANSTGAFGAAEIASGVAAAFRFG